MTSRLSPISSSFISSWRRSPRCARKGRHCSSSSRARAGRLRWRTGSISCARVSASCKAAPMISPPNARSRPSIRRRGRMNPLQLCVDALSLGSQYALVSLGIGLVFGVMRMINFAHGDLITLGAYALVVPTAADFAEPYIGNFPAIPLSSALRRSLRLRRSSRSASLFVRFGGAARTARVCRSPPSPSAISSRA